MSKAQTAERKTKMKPADYVALEEMYNAKNYKPLDVVLERGEGVWVWDVEGNKYMDFLAAYSALNQGHCHPRLVRALTDQAEKLALTSRAFRNDQLPLFAKELCELLDFEMMLPMNTGAEAIETAVKAARKWGYTVKGVPDDKAEIIVCDGNFHGRTTTIISFSSDEQYKAGFGPLTPGFVIIPYGDADALAAAMTPNTVAFLVEPVQGEAGVVVPPDGYLTRARELCDANNVLLVTDEIQSGLGRTGYMLAAEHDGVKADIVTLGKALAGGMYPVSAVVASREVLGVFEPGDHGSTFGGNPVACAVAREALKVIVDEGLCERATELGARATDRLQALDSPYVEFVRGRGLWFGIVLTEDAGGARHFCEKLAREGVLAKETHDNVIRLAPPLIISDDELDWALDKVEKILKV
jgi:ornithine--oxo-acid transaminase